MKNQERQFTIEEKDKDMLEELRKRGITCAIISGHSGNDDAKLHLDSCRDELTGIIDPNNIRFESKYSDKKSEKEAVIRNLQIYGNIDKPQNIFIRICSEIRAIFWPYTVGMVGDGTNDVGALKQADFSVGIKNGQVLNHEVTLSAHFNLQQTEIHWLPDLITGVQHAHKHYTTFLSIGLLFNLFMLLMVNGLCFGISIPAAATCIVTSLFCPVVIATAITCTLPGISSKTKDTTPSPNKTQINNPLSTKEMDTEEAKNAIRSGTGPCCSNAKCKQQLWSFLEAPQCSRTSTTNQAVQPSATMSG